MRRFFDSADAPLRMTYLGAHLLDKLKIAKNTGLRISAARLACKVCYFSSSGVKSNVMVLTRVRSWVHLTPAAWSIRLEARVVGVVPYLSER